VTLLESFMNERPDQPCIQEELKLFVSEPK
jgi:hypothetical protein